MIVTVLATSGCESALETSDWVQIVLIGFNTLLLICSWRLPHLLMAHGQ